MQTSGFSISRFYERRARRILPSLFFVMAVCLPVSWILLRPSDMMRFAQSLVAVPIFLSNVLFWNQSGYFEPDVELNPLLHTWSLAVEEQYYVFFPLVLILLFRRRTTSLLKIFLILTTLLSFMIAQWGALKHPSFAFYLLPTRAWELLLGAIISIYLTHPNKNSVAPSDLNSWAFEIGSAAGLILLLIAIFSFNGHTPFPGAYALVPTVGAALIIAFAREKTLVGKLLGSRMLVGIGLISYSAYLWHQPIFAFARYGSTSDPSQSLMIILIAVSIVLAYATWAFIERPFRDRTRVGARKILLVSILGSISFVLIGCVGIRMNGFDFRLSNDEKSIAAFDQYPVSKLYSMHKCFMELDDSFKMFSPTCSKTIAGKPTLLIWGDSYAAALSAGIKAVTQNVIQYTASSCPPFPGVAIPDRPNCLDINNFITSEIKRLQPDKILLHANWHNYGQEAPAKLANTINYISTASPKTKIIVIGSAPQWKPTLPVYLIRKGLRLDQDRSLRLPMYAELDSWDKRLETTAQRSGASFIPILPLICKDEICPVILRSESTFVPFSWDVGHLTKEGSDLIAGKVAPKVNSL